MKTDEGGRSRRVVTDSFRETKKALSRDEIATGPSRSALLLNPSCVNL